MTDPVTPDSSETVEKLRKALIGHAPNGDNLLKPDQQDAVRDALTLLTAQADELDRLRAENAKLRGAAVTLLSSATPHPQQHPAMYAAWQAAIEAIKIQEPSR